MAADQFDVEQNGARISERIGRIEATLGGLTEEFHSIRSTLKSIQEAQARSRETNWGVIFAGIAVAGGLWAAAIRPLDANVDRVAQYTDKIDEGLRRYALDEARQNAAFERLDERVTGLADSLTTIREKGSPITDRRLSLLEQWAASEKESKP